MKHYPLANKIGFSLFVLFVLALATWWRFNAWFPHVLSADDLFNYMLYHGDRFESHWADIFFADAGQKFRFMFSGIMHIEIFLFEKNIDRYIAVNIIVHSLSGVLLYAILLRYSRSLWIALLLSILAVTSRFGLYEIVSITGQVENISLFLCLLCVFAVIKNAESAQSNKGCSARWKAFALFCAFLAFNTHERYIVLLPWLFLFFVFGSHAGKIRERVGFVAISSVIIISNGLIKRYFYHSNFFQGTGGTPLSINIDSIWALLSQAALSMFGANLGPQYLVGANWYDFSIWIKFASIVFAVISLSLAGVALLSRKENAHTMPYPIHPILFVILMGLLLLPATLTIRMEQRWELGPFFIYLVLVGQGLALFSTTYSMRAITALLLGGLIIAACMIERRVSKSFPAIAYVYAASYAESVKDAIVDRPEAVQQRGASVIFITQEGNCIGTLLDGGFFLVYEGKPRKIMCIHSMVDVAPTDYPQSTRMFASKSQTELIDITAKWHNATVVPRQ